MTGAWIQWIAAAALLILGLVFLILAAFGVNRFCRALDRMHAAAMGDTLGILFVLYVECWAFPADIDAANYASGRENAYTLLGAVLGVNVVHYLDDQFLPFETQAPPLGQVLKLVLGLLVVLAVLEGLKIPFAALFGGHPAADAVRYFLVVFVAGCIWPMTGSTSQRVAMPRLLPIISTAASSTMHPP